MTAGRGLCPWKAGRGPVPCHRHWLAVPSPGLLQRSSEHVPGGDIHPAQSSLDSWTLPQWRLGLSCRPLCSHCRCPGLWPQKQEPGVSRSGCGLALAGRRQRAEAEPPSLRLLCHLAFILPSHLGPASALHSSAASVGRQAGSIHPSLALARVWIQPSCALRWCGLRHVCLSRPPAWD